VLGPKLLVVDDRGATWAILMVGQEHAQVWAAGKFCRFRRACGMVRQPVRARSLVRNCHGAARLFPAQRLTPGAEPQPGMAAAQGRTRLFASPWSPLLRSLGRAPCLRELASRLEGLQPPLSARKNQPAAD